MIERMERCESTIAAAVVTPAAISKAALALSTSRVEAMLLDLYNAVSRGVVSRGIRLNPSCTTGNVNAARHTCDRVLFGYSASDNR